MARRSRPLVKIVFGLAAIAVVGVLFLRTVRQAGLEPYTVRADRLAGWRVVVDPRDPQGALVGLRPPAELTGDLFRQIFRRTMVSLSSPAVPQMPLVLASELNAEEGGPDSAAVAALARAARLEEVRLQPRCLATRRMGQGSDVLEFHYLLFDLPEFERFRESLAEAASAAGAAPVDAGALAPVLLVAGSDRGLRGPLPFRPDGDRDCAAPVVVE